MNLFPKTWAAAVASALLAGSTAGATMVDLTTSGASGSIDGAIFQQAVVQPAGTGVIDSFLRLQNTGTEQGFNTDYRPVEFDEKTDPNFTRSLLLSSVPVVNINGTAYRQFLLDINESNGANKSQVLMSELKLFLEPRGDMPTLASLGTPVYDMTRTGSSNSVLMDAALNPGSGKSDVFVYIPDNVFAGATGPYLYLYSKFTRADGGFEEWAVGKPSPAVPEPSSVVLGLLGLGCVGGLRFRRYLQQHPISA